MAVKKQQALVVGGAGFVGKHLVRQLLESGRYEVTVFDVKDCGIAGIRSVVGDLRNVEQVTAAVAGMDVVFHCAAITPSRVNESNRSLMQAVNVGGTAAVIDACATHGVRKLVFTSSSSVVFAGRDLLDVDETQPYAEPATEFYSETKIAAEKLVLAANGRNGLLTCALRPASVFGEDDPLFLPSLVDNARKGKMKYMIGDGRNWTDFTYAGNVAAAHIQAAEALAPGAACVGQAYFITNGEPRHFWRFVGDVLEGLGYERPYIKLPVWLVYCIALLLQWVIAPLLAPFKRLETDFTPLKVTLVSSHRKFNIDKARRDFSYEPTVALDEALKRTLTHFAHLRNSSPQADGGSK